MSFLIRGDGGPTNIPEGRAGGLFQSIAQAGLQAAREDKFGRRGRRGRRGMKNRMAGDRSRRPIRGGEKGPRIDPRRPIRGGE